MKKLFEYKVLIKINFYIDNKFIPKLSRKSKQYIYEFENGIKGTRYKTRFVGVEKKNGIWCGEIRASKDNLVNINKLFGDL